MIKLCIFDLDGTLLDTLESIRHHLNATLVLHGLAEITRDECRSYIGNGARRLVERAAARSGCTDPDIVSRILREYNSAYDSAPIEHTYVYDGVSGLTLALTSSGIRLAILTNKPEPTALKLAEHFFPGAFAAVRGGADGRVLKPDPAEALRIARELGCLPSETVFIGDSGVDIETGHNMGAAATVGFAFGFRGEAELVSAGADLVTRTPSDVLGLIAGL